MWHEVQSCNPKAAMPFLKTRRMEFTGKSQPCRRPQLIPFCCIGDWWYEWPWVTILKSFTFPHVLVLSLLCTSTLIRFRGIQVLVHWTQAYWQLKGVNLHPHFTFFHSVSVGDWDVLRPTVHVIFISCLYWFILRKTFPEVEFILEIFGCLHCVLMNVQDYRLSRKGKKTFFSFILSLNLCFFPPRLYLMQWLESNTGSTPLWT